MIAVDTSAMVRLVMGGPDGEGAARLLLRDPEWAAPPVLLSELRNVLLCLVRQGSLILDQARAMCGDAASVLGPRIVTVSSDRALDAALAADIERPTLISWCWRVSWVCDWPRPTGRS